MDVIKDIDVDDIRVDVVRYCHGYPDFEKPNTTELWHKALLLCKDKPKWYDKALVIEICLARMLGWREIFQPPKSSENRPCLSSSSLNSIMLIKLRHIPITHFHDEFSDKIRENHTKKGNHRRSHAKNLT